jgi:hypothetical protein
VLELRIFAGRSQVDRRRVDPALDRLLAHLRRDVGKELVVLGPHLHPHIEDALDLLLGVGYAGGDGQATQPLEDLCVELPAAVDPQWVAVGGNHGTLQSHSPQHPAPGLDVDLDVACSPQHRRRCARGASGCPQPDLPVEWRAPEVAEGGMLVFGGTQLVLDGERNAFQVGDGADVIRADACRSDLACEERDGHVGDASDETTQQTILQGAQLIARHGLRLRVIEVAGRCHGRSTILHLPSARRHLGRFVEPSVLDERAPGNATSGRGRKSATLYPPRGMVPVAGGC